MENSYQAIIMAGSVLLFLIGISVAIYNYSKVLDANDKMLTNSEYYNRTAEDAYKSESYTVGDELNEDVSSGLKRKYKGSDIVTQILNMTKYARNSLGGIVGEDVSYDSIIVDGKTFTKVNDNGVLYVKITPKPIGSQVDKFFEDDDDLATAIKSILDSNDVYEITNLVFTKNSNGYTRSVTYNRIK